MKKIISFAAVVVLLIAPAVAQQRGQRRSRQRGFGGPTDPLAGAIDTDKDGTLSTAELAKASASLRSLDKDGDGAIDRNELRDAMRSAFTGGRGGGPGSPGSTTLQRAGLKLGQAVPDVTIHDDKGDKVRLADFKGKHTVIVFGCLT